MANAGSWTTGPWTERWVVVCGGTSGLGLQMVIAAAKQRANLVLIGRDHFRLESAIQVAIANGANSAIGFSIDLRSENFTASDSRSSGVGSLTDGIGGLGAMKVWMSANSVDLLINAVGRSDRGLLEQLSVNDLSSMLNDNLICTWQMTQLALESVKRARGVIVNIGSLAGLIAAPGMGGYSIAKSALTAMSRQMRLELARYGIHVMLVCPGPIAREDPSSRYEKLAAERGMTDSNATAPGGGVKLRLLDPVKLCNTILNSAHRRKKEIVVPGKAAWLSAIAALFPGLADWILSKYLRPKPHV